MLEWALPSISFALLEFLKTVVAQEPSNKMTLWNVSLVMAPNLFLHPGQSPKLSKGRENSWQRGSRSGANDGTLPGPALDGAKTMRAMAVDPSSPTGASRPGYEGYTQTGPRRGLAPRR